jgi:hypothetical protein
MFSSIAREQQQGQLLRVQQKKAATIGNDLFS